MTVQAYPITRDELIVDLFAGGGGASQGIFEALGRHPDIAINHDAAAIAVHTCNHPDTQHFCQSIWEVKPVQACAGRPVGLLWASPDCRHFSRAAGGRPKWKSVRSLPGVVLTWAKHVRPKVIMVENVPEMQDWGATPAVRAMEAEGWLVSVLETDTIRGWRITELGRLELSAMQETETP